jgi:hypothetical protein
MTRKELINSLETWKSCVDPDNRVRNYDIINFEDKLGKYEHVIIRLNRKFNSFNFTVNEQNAVIIECIPYSQLSIVAGIDDFKRFLEEL